MFVMPYRGVNGAMAENTGPIMLRGMNMPAHTALSRMTALDAA